MSNEDYKIAYENVMTANKMLEQEIERLKEQLNDEIDDELKQSEIMVKKQEEIERLTAESTKWESKFYDEAKKVDRAIKYMEDNSKISLDDCVSIINFYRELLSILKGVDRE